MKILAVAHNLDSAVAYYRLLQPLVSITDNCVFKTYDSVSWADINIADNIIVSKPDSPIGLRLIQQARMINKYVIVDWDDDLLNVPRWAFSNHHINNNKKVILECLNAANHVWVSTSSIGKSIRTVSKVNYSVVPNSWTLNFTNKPSTRNKVAIWRGSVYHHEDTLILNNINDTIKKFQDWTFLFIGMPPFYIDDDLKNVVHVEEMSISGYFSFLQHVNASLMFTPLVKNTFNMGKSNISWLEATYAGLNYVGMDFGEFEKLKGTVKCSEENFIETLETQLTLPFNELSVKISRNQLTEEFHIDKINKIRLETLNE